MGHLSLVDQFFISGIHISGILIGVYLGWRIWGKKKVG